VFVKSSLKSDHGSFTFRNLERMTGLVISVAKLLWQYYMFLDSMYLLTSPFKLKSKIFITNIPLLLFWFTLSIIKFFLFHEKLKFMSRLQ